MMDTGRREAWQVPRVWWRSALLNFLMAALIGAILRYAFVEELSWMNYRYFMHAHSHVAMLGWVYLALYTLLLPAFLTQDQQRHRFYRGLFWATEAAVIGMLISFPLQGYGGFSIFFSSLHVLLSYAFAWRFWRDLGKPAPEHRMSSLLIRTAIIWMVLSTLALWAMGPVMATGQRSTFYYLIIQFFLHFQFNGWFLFAILALLLRLLESRGIHLSRRRFRPFYLLLVASCILTFALAVAWANPLQPVFWFNSFGVLMQLAAVLFLFALIHPLRRSVRALFTTWQAVLFQTAFWCLVVKVAIQAAVVIPYIATIAYTIRNYVIGFIHLLLLGIISIFLFAYADYLGLARLDRGITKAGLAIFLTGVALVEGLLFLQGTLLWGGLGFLPAYYEILFGFTCLMPLGLGVYLFTYANRDPGA